jgi:hypothetical protein
MNEHERANLEEMLNSYVDGELSERQCNEVKRLIANNEQAAKMLKELQKCKSLLGSLPRTQAPAHLIENVRASLERSVLLDEYHGKGGAKAGVVHLFARRMMAAAAMIVLVGVLGIVVYNIVKPEPAPTRITRARPAVTPVVVAVPVVTLAKMELGLKTDQATAVNQFIYRNIILDNGLQDMAVINRSADKNVYSISCTRARAGMVLEELGTIWDKFKATQLSVDGVDSPIADVTAVQAIQIAKAVSAQVQIQLAKDFAAANKTTAEQPVKEVAAAAGDTSATDITITKPALTSGAAKAGPNEPADAEKVNLTIVITSM